MSEIIVRRKAASWQDRIRNYAVLIDGTEAGKVANGAEVRIPVAPGNHVVALKIDWCGSNPVQIDLKPGESRTLDCGPNATPLLTLLFITLRRNQYLWLRPGDNSLAAGQETTPNQI